jgi:hypothetical protein
MEEELEKDVFLSLILFKLYGEDLTNKALEWFGDLRIGRQVYRTVKYGDKLVLLATEETELYVMFDRLREIGILMCDAPCIFVYDCSYYTNTCWCNNYNQKLEYSVEWK